MTAPAYILVEHPGTDQERVVDEFPDQHAASRALALREDDGVPLDVIERAADGTLRVAL